MAERGVRERLERLVQRAQLVRDPQHPVAVIEPAVERLELACDPIEALEQRIELPVGDVFSLHGLEF